MAIGAKSATRTAADVESEDGIFALDEIIELPLIEEHALINKGLAIINGDGFAYTAAPFFGILPFIHDLGIGFTD